MTLAIEVIPGTNPPIFRWHQALTTVNGAQTIEHNGTLPPAVERAVADLVAQARALQAFKDWVHKYLDDHGVPYHPPGAHGAAGCRIGDRMDWLLARLPADTAEAPPATPAPGQGKPAAGGPAKRGR